MKNVIWYSLMVCSVFFFILSVIFIIEGDKRLVAADKINKETVRLNSNINSIYSDSFKKDMEYLKADRVNQYVKTLGNIKNEETIFVLLKVFKEGYEQGFNDLLYTFIR